MLDFLTDVRFFRAFSYIIQKSHLRGGKMTVEDLSYKDKKVISIGIVSELTGLSVRQIRYYEERKLIYPQRSTRGTRKYSFADVERLMEIANKREDGVQTAEILKDMRKKEQRLKTTSSSERKCSKASLTLILNTKTVKKTNHSLRFIPFKSPGIRHNLNQIYFLVYPVIKSQAIRKDTTKKVKKWSKINLRGHSTSPASSAYKCMSWIQKETPISLNLRMWSVWK